MTENVLCGGCGALNESISKTLKCSKCGVEHIYDKTFETYLPKNVVCANCHKMSKTISTDYLCNLCGARYDVKSKFSLDDILGGLFLLIIFGGLFIFGIYEVNRDVDVEQGILFIIFGFVASAYFLNGFYKYWKKPPRVLVFANEASVQQEPKQPRIAEMKEKLKQKKKKIVAFGKTQPITYAKQPKAAIIEKPSGGTNWLGGFIAAVVFLAIAGGIYIWLDSGAKIGWTNIEVSDMSFSVPSDWTADKYSDPDFVVTVFGPDEGNSKPNFNIQQSFGYIEDFDYEAQQGRTGLELSGATVTSQYTTTVAGKPAVCYMFNLYIPDKEYYGRGTALLIKVNPNELVMIVFASKESSYWKNVATFDQIMATLKFKS